MHYKLPPRSKGVVGSEPSHWYKTSFLSFSSDNGHSRSRSLNDIDCSLQFSGLYECQKHVCSKSSDEALNAAAQTKTYPLVPCHAPLFQSPTPNGLPEFGSREAQKLRLVPLSRIHRLADALHRRVRQVEHNSESNAEDERDRATSPNQTEFVHSLHTQPETPADILRRIMGTVIPVSVPRPPSRPRRASLPKGIIRASQPGPLAQAGDGSQVRGRFGNRASGHGIGQRTISIHPLAQLRESSGLQDAIEEIEKACANEDARQRRSEHRERHERRRRSTSATQQYQRHGVSTIEVDAAAQALGGEQRAVQAPEQQRREKDKMPAQSKAFTAPSTLLDARVSNRHASPGSTGHQLARLGQLPVEETSVNRRVQMTSDQTVTSLSPDEAIGITASIDMIVPTLYSSYSSFSCSSAEVNSQQAAHIGRDIPTVDSMFERQRPESASDATEEQQRPSVPKLFPLNIC